MSKKLKGNSIDPLLLKKIDTIVHEIETLQVQGIGIKDIYNKISVYLEEEPSLTVPLVDALVKLPKPETAQLFEKMLAEYLSRLRKASDIKMYEKSIEETEEKYWRTMPEGHNQPSSRG